MTGPDDFQLEPTDDSQRAQQIRRVIEEYFERRELGDKASDRQLIERYPDLMPELGEELDKLKLIGTARRKAETPSPTGIDESTRSDVAKLPSASHGFSRGSGTRLYVRCPDCRQRIEVESYGSFARLVCGKCGGRVRLIRDTDERHDSTEPKSIAHFQLIELLGTGSFGAVWKANDTALDRTVALKVPRQDQVSSIGDEKFFREARTCAQLNHPNIVSVHEVGRDGNTVYIVSDFIDGITLSQWLAANRPTPDEAATLCALIAEALHHAHEAGVVHRDLKPGNIMMDRDAKPYIMDFGLAKREVNEVTMTVEGRILGTPAYMSPEQARGDGYAVDRRTDVFSLGVVLFQLLTGELPFRGNARMLILQILGDESPRPRKLHNQIPADLETITLKCMEREPIRRYQSASDDGSVVVWDVDDGRPAAKPLIHPDWVFSACFNNDGRHVLTGCRDHMARLWDWRPGTLVCPPLEHEDELFCARFLPDNRWIITSGRDRTVRVWESITGRAVTPPWPLSGYGHQLRVTPDGRFAVVAGAMPTLNVFGLEDLLDAAQAQTEPDPDTLRLLGEILSGRAIHRGGGTVNLTSAEWLDRWQEYQARVGTNATRLFGKDASP